MQEEILQLDNVSKKFGSQYAVKNLSFSLYKGEILGFLGPNGAGKSTTMKMITGYYQPSQGNIIFKQKNIRQNSKQVKQQIGYLPEQNPLYYDMFVKEFLYFIAELYNIPKKERKNRVQQIVSEVGLTPEAHKKIGQLSKGYKQRVGLAQALLSNPELIILDEPTSGLDPNQVTEIRELIKKIGQQKTILFSSHILSEVEHIANRIIILHQGEKKLDMPLKELKKQFQGDTVLEIEVEYDHFPILQIQENEYCSKIIELSSRKWQIHTKNSTELRKIIYQLSIQHNNPLLLIYEKSHKLEDIFKETTHKI